MHDLPVGRSHRLERLLAVLVANSLCELARELRQRLPPLRPIAADVDVDPNAIAPGLVKTEFARVLYEDPQRRAAREAATPLRRLGEPEDIAGVALMLASRAGAFITGQTIIVDGGTTIAP